MKTASFILFAAVVCSACDAPDQHQAQAARPAPEANVSVPHNGLLPGTPAGDLDAWTRDIRAGIERVPELLKSDRAAAQRAALDMYITRQEYAEMYYGIDGRIKGSPELSQAIETAEEPFHMLMQLLNGKTPDPHEVAAAVKFLDEQQATVEKLWKASGLHLDRGAK